MNKSDFYSEIEESIPMYKVIVLGCTGSGKTALLTRYQHNFYDDHGVTTLSVDFNIKKRENAWYYYYDTSGQQRYRALISGYYRGADACILVYDITKPKTFDEMAYYSSQIQQNVPDALVYIVGCKCDMPKSVSDQEVTRQYPGVRHVITSSKLNQGVKQLFIEIEQDLLKYKKKQINQNRKSDIFSDKDIKANTKTQHKSDKKKSCCSK